MFIAAVYLVFAVILTNLTKAVPYHDRKHVGETVVLCATVQTAYQKNSNLVLELTDARELPQNFSKTDISSEIQNLSNTESHGVIAYISNEEGRVQRPKCGSTVVVSGKKALFERAENFGQFDMALYEQSKGKDYCIFDTNIIAEGKDHDPVKETLLIVRERVAKIYSGVFEEDEAGVLDAMVLGDRSSLPSDIKGLYQRSGVAHALSISGLHIGIIGYGIYKLLKKLRANKYIRTGVSVCVMLLYCVMTGSSLSAMRAFIMFALGLYADICARTYDMLSAMALSIMILLAAQPMKIYEAGFWLSYGAIAGAAVVYPHMRGFIKSGNKIVSSFLFSVSIFIFTFPITAYFFYQIPLYGVVLNLFVIPLLAPLLFCALITAVLGFIYIKTAFPFVIVCKIILKLTERGCALCERLPMGIVVTGKPELWKIALYYTGLFALIIFTPRLKGMRIRTGVNVAAAVVLIGLQCAHHDKSLKLVMLSVGQGQCIFIQSPDGKTCLYDCGSTSEKNIGEYRVEPFLKASGEAYIDCCIVSHTDEDHISGFSELIEDKSSDAIKIGTLIMPDIGNPDGIYLSLTQAAVKKGITVLRAGAGDEFKLGDIDIRCLNPEKKESYADKNTYSMVLELKYKKFSALLTGDVQDKGEENVTAALNGGYTVLQVAHHGSKNSTPDAFLNAAKPKIALISAGRNNRYKHPHAQTLERLSAYTENIYVTMDTGAISIKSDGEKLNISTFLQKEPGTSRIENKEDKDEKI